MKRLFAVLLLSSASSSVFAAGPAANSNQNTPVVQTIQSLDITLPCEGLTVNINADPTVNVYSSSGGFRVPSFATNQVFVEHNQLIIQASSGEYTVLGDLKQEPSCAYDSDGVLRPAWVNIKKSAAVDIKVTIIGHNFYLTIFDAKIPHNYNTNWTQ